MTTKLELLQHEEKRVRQLLDEIGDKRQKLIKQSEAVEDGFREIQRHLKDAQNYGSVSSNGSLEELELAFKSSAREIFCYYDEALEMLKADQTRKEENLKQISLKSRQLSEK